MNSFAGLSLVPALQFVARVSQLFAFPFVSILGLVAITTTHCTDHHAHTRALAWHGLALYGMVAWARAMYLHHVNGTGRSVGRLIDRSVSRSVARSMHVVP